MTTVLAVYNSDGCQGRCDSRCHGAMTEECHCVCGGANHGRGSLFAAENTRAMFNDMLAAYGEKVAFTEVEVPAMYTCQTRTAIKIARTINAQKKFNAVLDVRKDKRSKKTVWVVDMRPYEHSAVLDEVLTVEYANLKQVELGNAQMQMFPEVSPVTVEAVSDDAFAQSAVAEERASFQEFGSYLKGV